MFPFEQKLGGSEKFQEGVKKCLARSFLLVMVAVAWLVGNRVSSAVVLLFYSSVSLPWLNHCPSYFFMIAEPYQSFDENIFLTLNTDLAGNHYLITWYTITCRFTMLQSSLLSSTILYMVAVIIPFRFFASIFVSSSNPSFKYSAAWKGRRKKKNIYKCKRSRRMEGKRN